MYAAAKLVAMDHTFALADGPDFPIESANWSTGIGAQMSAGCMIYTGVNKGIVNIEAAALESALDIWQPHSWSEAMLWDDVVEISVNAPEGNLSIHQQSYGPFDLPPDLPNMSPLGPGTYRLRIYARGRDENFDKDVEESTEHYRLVSWPAAFLPAVIVRATTRCGYSMRVGELNPPIITDY